MVRTGSGEEAERIYRAAVYLRLSREDEDNCGRESNSITNQKRLIREFLKTRKDIRIFREYVDDGYSGCDFRRPAFREMIRDVEAGEADLVIVKDLSRFGREYIGVGQYLQRIFPAAGVRFIAVTDHYDSLTADTTVKNIVLPVKNFINDAYSADLSVKIKSHLAAKRENGEYTGAYVSYGFQKEGEDRHKLEIDPQAGRIVKMIFDRKLQGLSNRHIAGKLNELGILAPADYKRRSGSYESGFQKNPCSGWSAQTVGRILEDPLCNGLVVQGKRERINHKLKKTAQKPEKERNQFYQEELALIGKEKFDKVQELLKRDVRISPGRGEAYPCSGLLFCPDCGRQMIRRKVSGRKISGRKASGRKVSGMSGECAFYICKTYNKEKDCTRHSIREEQAEFLLQEALQVQIRLFADREQVRRAAHRSMEALKKDMRDCPVADREKEMKECREILSGLWEDLQEGILTGEEYKEMKEFYSLKTQELEEQNRAGRKWTEEAGERRKKAVEKLAQFENTQSRTLDREEGIDKGFLNFMIDRMWVYEGKRVEIFFSFCRRKGEM